MKVKLYSATPKELGHSDPSISSPPPSNSSRFEYNWIIGQFKDWHENKPRKAIESPVLITTGPKRSKRCKFQMRLVSEGVDPATGRVHLKLSVEYYTRRFFQLVPVDVKVSVIDENGLKRHTQEFLLASVGVPRSVYIARYFYRTRKDDLKQDNEYPFYLIIDNTATFHIEAKVLSAKEMSARMKQEEQALKAKADQKKKEKAAAAKTKRPVVKKIIEAVRNLALI